MAPLKVTFKTSDSESTIKGNASSGPSPKMVYPPFYNFRFKEGYTTQGDIWDKESFDADSFTVEYNDKTYHLPKSNVTQKKDEGEYPLYIMVCTQEPPENPKDNLPFFSD